jgi:adenosylcobinamide-phosphate synthase
MLSRDGGPPIRAAIIGPPMSFFAVLFALLIEQLKPLPRSNVVHESLGAWTRWTRLNFDAGRESHAWVVWGVTVLVPSLLAFGVWLLLNHVNVLLGLAWNVAVLYVTLGFRQFSHYFTDIRDALERADEDSARRLLAQWRHVDASDLPRAELLRQVIEHSLLAAHRHVFGVFFWFVVVAALGLGPAGAVLYRMSDFAVRHWGSRPQAAGDLSQDRLSRLSAWLFGLLDHVPARLTAFGFAVVGNFEDAVNCWRRDAVLWESSNDGVILASAAGAVGVRLGGREAPPNFVDLARGDDDTAGANEVAADGSTTGATPEVSHLRSVVALVWRSVVLWMLLLALLSLANLVG